MATGANAGYKGVILMSSSAGGSVTRIAEVTNWTLRAAMAEINATSHDSSGDREVIDGVRSYDGTAEYLHVQTGATHKNAVDRLLDSAKVQWEFFPTGSSSDGYFSAAGYVNSWEIASPNEDAFASNIGFVVTGALSRSSSST